MRTRELKILLKLAARLTAIEGKLKTINKRS
ncbi:hypothetical protein GGR92_004806 [Spirosoma lacussanchae]